MSQETTSKLPGWAMQYLPAIGGALMAWGAMKAEVLNLKDEVGELREHNKAQDVRIANVERDASAVGAKLEMILKELQALREDIRGRAPNH